MMCERPLTPKQEAFCRILAMPGDDGNEVVAYVAYLRAFGSCTEDSARRQARKLLRDERIMARVHELREDAKRLLGQAVSRAGIASKAKRLLRKNKHWEAICQLIDQRAASSRGIPELDSGLMVPVPGVTDPRGGQVYQLDKASLDVLNDLEESAAKELGQIGSNVEAASESSAQVIFILPDNGRDQL